MNRACLLVALALCALGCTRIIADGNPRCSTPAPGDPDPCPAGRVCVGGICEICIETDELCNGLDDDCDGAVDELHDTDGDGYTWCGGGDMSQVDCDDHEPAAFPNATETCDGVDNDCDAGIDEAGPGLCPDMGQACSAGQCSAPDCTLPGFECMPGSFCDVAQMPPTCAPGACTPGSCPMGQVCDTTSGCLTPVGLGEACTIDAQCAEGVCMPSAAFGVSGADRCSRACCDDQDCPADMVCTGDGSGARACLPASFVGGIGAGDASDGCNDGDDCRSGVCRGNDTCVENCATHGDCANGDYSCRAIALASSETVQLSCVEGDDGGGVGSFCFNSSACQSGVCFFDSQGFQSVCLGGCGSRADCPVGYHCGNVNLTSGDAEGNTQLCVPTNHSGSGTSGDTCTVDNDCADRTCVDGSCADACCGDTDCPGGFACRPVPRGASWAMRCVD